MSRSLAWALAALALAASGPAAARWKPDPARDAYEAELARQCPQKHLELLDEAALADPAEAFVEGLTADQRKTARDLEKIECGEVEFGQACFDTSTLHAAQRLDALPRLAAQVCAAPWSCAGPGPCRQTGR